MKSVKKTHDVSDNTWFVRIIHWFFQKCSAVICYCPWTCIILTIMLTLVLSLKIPFTRMQNDISDFTPFGARSRVELEKYRKFFNNHGEPKAIYAFITSKVGDNMLGISQLNDTVHVLDTISRDFYLKTSQGPKNFEEYCSGFCLLNEPVKHFYSGMLISGQHGTDFSHLDLGYPITTVLGTKLYMDPNFFGVKVTTSNNKVESIADGNTKLFGDHTKQEPNNIREVSLVVLQFRSELGDEVTPEDLRNYEHQILDYIHDEYQSEHINVYILTDSYITEEIVRAGLTLLPFLVIGFTIMAVFSSITFVVSAYYTKQLNFYKPILAVMACVCPFMACGASLGAMFFIGFRFGSILCVTPFLVLAIGVDDSYLMANAWQRITCHRRKHARFESVNVELKNRITEMFIETGPSITITTITNALAFGIGATTPAAEIQLFSIGNALAVITDFVFTITFYGALMAVVGRYEIEQELKTQKPLPESESPSETSSTGSMRSSELDDCKFRRMIANVCKFLTNTWVCSVVLGLLAVYWYICIVGTVNIKSELSPNKLFLAESNIVEIFKQRKSHIIPYYSACWVLVENPGDINNPNQRAKLEELIESFEALPSANGRYSTKFWLRDYEDFLKQSEEIDLPMEEEEDEELAIQFTVNGSQVVTPSQPFGQGNELRQFLEWPEFSFWKGFIQVNESTYQMSKFLVTTAYHGSDLVDWSNRAKLLNEWRSVADQDKFKSLNVTVYEEDAKFLDLIETMSPVAIQSALWTFASMFLVAALFISHPPTLFVATFSILSTSLGVFGIMSWWGADLDPIMMSATVMSIGFSVDIPSHVSYHFYQTAKDTSDIRRRLQMTIEAVGFPIFEASLSTSLCVMSLFFVDLNMAQIFAKCMLLVVVIGMVHGMLVMPVIFALLDTVPRKLKPRKQHLASTVTVVTVVP
ncbi:SSD domain-containing protein [Caenorhabditis elegans]|uniref:SSD domain-containing protein n=1 Tax=Caenorhabditis elegans TaxID=6239 RepID=O16530_CAEEL|nr:SSD domain-containing protein [Caenorhabditis elegans]CCD62841.2 SSD domain-containing protein [Caenorhabditis elegans]|eukprot:NP_493718.2 PaTched Related family [Caenorhabditis elegans]